MGVGRRGAHSQKAIATIDGTSLSRPERYCGLYAAQRAFYGNLHALAREGLAIGLHVGCDPLVLFDFARAAALGVVFQTFVRKEKLLPGGKDKLLSAINTSQDLILILVHCGPPIPCSLMAAISAGFGHESNARPSGGCEFQRSFCGHTHEGPTPRCTPCSLHSC